MTVIEHDLVLEWLLKTGNVNFPQAWSMLSIVDKVACKYCFISIKAFLLKRAAAILFPILELALIKRVYQLSILLLDSLI